MSLLYQLKKYAKYCWSRGNEHSIHSPFVFKLYNEAIKNKQKYYAFDAITKVRKHLLQNHQTIDVLDLGAGSKRMNNIRKISEIAEHSCVNQKYGELLFRLVNYFKPQSVLELGTSLGLSSLYMANAAPAAHIITIEGCPNTFLFAKKLLDKENIKNAEAVNAPFDEAFETTVKNKHFDFVYIDGNHTYEATIKYFNLLLTQVNENSILIFDDIYWTPQMTRAWEEIKNHKLVTVTIDLYKVGIVFFRKENKQKEHFCLKY